MYQNLKHALPKKLQKDSVHFMLIPEVNAAARNAQIEEAVKRMQLAINLGRKARETR